VLLVFQAVVLISPLSYLLGLRTMVVVPATLAAIVIIVALHDRRISTVVLLFIVSTFVTSTVSGVYWGSLKVALLPALLGCSVLLASIANETELRRVVTISSFALLLLLLGGWLSFVLAFQGMGPIGTISTATGRVLYVLPTTLTTVAIGDFVRPAGIYDEPGALSFVVCVFAFLRHWFQMDKRLTWALLMLGFITFSLAHVVYVAVHVLSERRMLVVWRNLILVLCIAIAGLSFVGVWETFDARLLARVSIASGSERIVVGDNRSARLLRALDTVDEGGAPVLFLGVDVSCIEGSPLCILMHPDIGENPISPLAYHGLLLSWPYYLFLIFTVGFGVIRRSWWPLLGVGLLFMQRPYLMNPGYSALAALVLLSVIGTLQARERMAALFGKRSSTPIAGEAVR
jgi:hypothetical protein